RRFVIRPRPLYRRLHGVITAYGNRSATVWQQTFKALADPSIRAAEREGKAMARRLSLPADREREAIAQAAMLGIGPTDRIVTVHVRESGYRSTAGLRQRQWDELRNARIETYFAAFNALVERGFTVVRLGDPSMTP